MLKNKIISRLSSNADVIKVNHSHCSRMRFNENRCSKCADCCPQKAVRLEGGPGIDYEACTECMLCV
ncbi:MAG: hypothetical protein C4526_09735, partial [Nitrospiraceae bacterium]